MSHGRPDWTSSINITGQDLAEVIERPKYGGAQTANYWAGVLEGLTENIFSISGTGMIYGGYIVHRGAFSTLHINNILVVDGTPFSYMAIGNLNDLWIENESMWYLYEKYYSEENDKYIHGISRGITFETSWSLYVQNVSGSGATDTVQAEVIYALI